MLLCCGEIKIKNNAHNGNEADKDKKSKLANIDYGEYVGNILLCNCSKRHMKSTFTSITMIVAFWSVWFL